MDCVSGPERAAGGEGEGGERARKADWDLRGSPGKSGGSLSVAVCVKTWCENICASDCTSDRSAFPDLPEYL